MRVRRSAGVAFVAAAIVFATWASASPVGAIPDDVYHLASIWCAAGSQADRCELRADGTADTPRAVVAGNCHAHHPAQSGGCIIGDDLGVARNFPGKYQPPGWGQFYPPVFYRTMHVFVSDDVSMSAAIMRVVNALLALLVAAGVLLLAPEGRRGSFALAWLATVVPVGMFMIASTSPQSWGIIGAASAWAYAFIAWEQPTSRRRAMSGGLCAAAVIMAFAARVDSGVFAVLGVALGLALSDAFRSWARAHLVWIGAAAAALASALVLQTTISGQGSLVRTLIIPDQGVDSDQLYQNLAAMPGLWFGNFGSYGGDWGLGQLDTVLPAAVGVLSFSAFIGTIMIGLGRSWPLKNVAIGIVTAVLITLPAWMFQQGIIDGAKEVGIGVQPRYLLPLMILISGFAVTSRRPDIPIRMSNAQRRALWITLTLAHAVALHTVLRRYVSGQDVVAFDLTVRQEWWWHHLPNPQSAWWIGSVAFAIVAYVVLAQFRSPRPPARQVEASAER